MKQLVLVQEGVSKDSVGDFLLPWGGGVGDGPGVLTPPGYTTDVEDVETQRRVAYPAIAVYCVHFVGLSL